MLRALPVSLRDGQHIFVDLRDGLSHRLLAGSPWNDAPWEPDEQEIIRRVVHRDDAALDVGAHMGLHAVLLSALVGAGGAVHAFEVNPLRVPALRETLRRLPNATLHTFGLADRAAATTLYVPEDQTMASLADWTNGRVGRVTPVTGQLQTLDALVRGGRVPPPDFVKCDVEGAETMVFSGGRAALDRADAPIILYEADARSTAAFGLEMAAATRILRGLTRAAYSIYWVQPNATLQAIDLPAAPCEHFNLLAVPASRRDRLTPFAVTN